MQESEARVLAYARSRDAEFYLSALFNRFMKHYQMSNHYCYKFVGLSAHDRKNLEESMYFVYDFPAAH